jgi:hypothetical protein
MSDGKAAADVEILILDPDPVEAPLFANKSFKIVGHGFSKKKIDVYISSDKNGNNKISEINVDIVDQTTITDEFLMVYARPRLGAPMNTKLWVVVELNGKFQSSIDGFKVV